MKSIRPLTVPLLLSLASCTSTGLPALGWTTQVYGPHALAATLDSANVRESSGVVAGRLNADIYWTQNDSGSAGPRVWAFRLNAADKAAQKAKTMGYVELAGASNIDWEDIAYGPGHRIYILDGGDNPPCDRTDKRIHRFVEPTFNPDGDPIALTLPFESIRFEFPNPEDPLSPAVSDDQRYDTECLFVHPVSGDMYVVTKRRSDGGVTARVYKLPAAGINWYSTSVYVLEFVKDLSGVIDNMTTAGDVDADGRRVVIRNYASAFEFNLPAGEPFDVIFDQVPLAISLLGEIQGEGICYARDGGDLIATSEVILLKGKAFGPSTMPVFVVPWRLANLRAESHRPSGATIEWDTATAMVGTVHYGPTTAYGQTASSSSPATKHVHRLDGLQKKTKYYYQAAANSTTYPPATDSEKFFFNTTEFYRPDFDRDHDVDLSDFGHLQRCLSGPSIPQLSLACADTLLDADPDVDTDDLMILLNCMSGANVPPRPDCDP